MAQITTYGYNDVKAYVISNWASVSIKDNTNAQILRLSTSDSRITWTSNTVNPIVATIVLKGSDSDLVGVLPKTFASVQLFKTNADVNGMTTAEAFTNFTMTSVDDQLTIKFNVEFPS